jgi:hypothetical protein
MMLQPGRFAVGELAQHGIGDIETANRRLREVYLPRHNRRFGRPPAEAQSTFVVAPDRAWSSRYRRPPPGRTLARLA